MKNEPEITHICISTYEHTGTAEGGTTLLSAQDEMHNSFQIEWDIKEMISSILKMQQTVGGGINVYNLIYASQTIHQEAENF